MLRIHLTVNTVGTIENKMIISAGLTVQRNNIIIMSK